MTTLLGGTKDVFNRAMGMTHLKPEQRIHAAFGEEFGFGSTDCLTAMILDQLHSLGLLLDHKIIR